MKVVVRCVNCNKIVRRSGCYHVRLLGKIDNSSVIQKPKWEEWEEKVWLCKPCALQAGYKVGKKPKEANVEEFDTLN